MKKCFTSLVVREKQMKTTKSSSHKHSSQVRALWQPGCAGAATLHNELRVHRLAASWAGGASLCPGRTGGRNLGPDSGFYTGFSQRCRIGGEQEIQNKDSELGDDIYFLKIRISPRLGGHCHLKDTGFRNQHFTFQGRACRRPLEASLHSHGPSHV